MGKVINGIVVDNQLFCEYHKFRNGEKFDINIIRQLFHFYKKRIVSNIKQYEDNKVELPANLKVEMAHAGLRRQSLEDLAENCTLYKIILSVTRNDFPYINIMDDRQRLENNYAASFDMGETRKFAVRHLCSMCLHAKKIVLYDKYFSKNENNIDLLKKILPKKKLEIVYSSIEDEHIDMLKQWCADFVFTKNPSMPNRHDRYMVIDDKLEIILTSGFDHLNDDRGDFTYIVRYVQHSRF
ncbi:hypothetical protein [Xylanibacter rarus]|jgi:hypothetical protein|uniref:hypothetical protein n=1 Tax=Xylanibacter rarus TaxID=1676614 RepID=UPI00352221A3